MSTPTPSSKPAVPVPGTLLYKCSHCGVEFAGYGPLTNGPGMLQALIDYTNGTNGAGTMARPWPANGLPYAWAHACSDGVTGIGYVTGMKPGK